jgi:hypothetical protein
VEEAVIATEAVIVEDPDMSIFAPETEPTEPSEETKSGDVFRP